MTQTITKLLIANRGEIACRIIKTARKLGIQTVAVYSDVDANALHVLEADQAVLIGSAPSKDSYLNMAAVLKAVEATGADAVHPGYGFLSENAEFASLCFKNDIVFVGPPAEAIQAMGSKSAAKKIMEQAGVPLLPGYHGDDQSLHVLKRTADEMGYPVLLKAVAGGGGKGMRQVSSGEEFEEALNTAKREAKSSFGDDVMLVEKFLTRPRHVEVQVFFDQSGRGVYLFERDCSVQRRHQKIIEEAPAPGLSNQLRKQMGEAAVQAASAINYVGAGTVEFLLDEDGTFYFMEMNTRLQVEHPVTEYVTGQDLVEWQLRVAGGEPLPLQQEDLSITGHAFEARIYAEDANKLFLPQTGVLKYYAEPVASEFVRVDSGVRSGDEVSVYYDPMIAKLITWDNDRGRALARMRQAINDFHVCGVTTNISFLRSLATHPAFDQAELSTVFINEHENELWLDTNIEKSVIIKIGLFLSLKAQAGRSGDPWSSLGQWRLNSAKTTEHHLLIEEQQYSVTVLQEKLGYLLTLDGQHYRCNGELHDDLVRFEIDGVQGSASVYFDGSAGKWFGGLDQIEFCLPEKDLGEESAESKGDFRAPMNGTIVEVAAKAGERVEAGAVLIVMEAMKMEHSIYAPCAGVVAELFCETGQLVDGGSTLLEFDREGEA